jgi:hypothetical protein
MSTGLVACVPHVVHAFEFATVYACRRVVLGEWFLGVTRVAEWFLGVVLGGVLGRVAEWFLGTRVAEWFLGDRVELASQ